MKYMYYIFQNIFLLRYLFQLIFAEYIIKILKTYPDGVLRFGIELCEARLLRNFNRGLSRCVSVVFVYIRGYYTISGRPL